MTAPSLYSRNTLNAQYYDKWLLNEEIATCVSFVEKTLHSKFIETPVKINRIVYKIHHIGFPPFTFLLNLVAFFYKPLQEQIQTYNQLKETLNNLQHKWPNGEEVDLAKTNLDVMDHINWMFSGKFDEIPNSKNKILEYKNPSEMEAPILKGLNDEGHHTILVRLHRIQDQSLVFLTITQRTDNHWVFKLGDVSDVKLASPNKINKDTLQYLRDLMTKGTKYFRIANDC